MKRKQKPNAYQRQLAEDWERTLQQHSKPLERGAKMMNTSYVPREPTSSRLDIKRVLHTQVVSPSRERLNSAPSKVTPGGNTAVSSRPTYTGDKMLGVATMHKSNMIPIFSQEEAIEVANMRRPSNG